MQQKPPETTPETGTSTSSPEHELRAVRGTCKESEPAPVCLARPVLPSTRLFVLSLQRERLRRLSAINQVQGTGLTFEIVDALDAAMTRTAVLRTFSGSPMTPGEVACYHSHLGILQRVVDYGLDLAAVLEDDFHIANASPFPLAELWRQIPPGVDHLQLHAYGGRWCGDYKVVSECEQFQIVRPTSLLTIGYVVSRQLAELMVRKYRLPRMPIDRQYAAVSVEHPHLLFMDVKHSVIEINSAFRSTIRRS